MRPFSLNISVIVNRGKPLTLIALLVIGLLIYATPMFITPAGSAQMGAFINLGNSDILAVTLENNVTVYRDSWGVPHIYSQSASDAYVALGYCMAQDRMFEMDLIRRYTAGRLSEIFGPDYLSIDIAARTMGFYKIAEDTWNGAYAPDIVIPLDVKENLEQFATGVSLYTSLWPDGIPMEYYILALSGVPYALSLPNMTQNLWKPQESLAVAGFMGWDLTDSSEAEIMRGVFASQVDPAFAAQGLPGVTDFLMPTGWINATTIMPSNCSGGGGGGGGGSYTVYDALKELSDVSAMLRASNNWVINQTVSATGNAMLCNDPHLMLQTPGINWEVHIKTNDYNLIGCMIPGGPSVYTGHNDHFAFGVTNLMADVLDLYYYVFDNDTNPTEYWFEPTSTWVPVQTHVEYITVVGTPVPVTINSTMHGPLIDTPAGRFAFKWVGKQSGYGEVTGFSKMMSATNRAEWKEACSDMCVIIQNYVYADKDGNISWCPSGRIPVRDPNGTMGVVPSNGSAGENEWIQVSGKHVFIPHSTNPGPVPGYPFAVSLPYCDDPEEGFIVTANNQPIDSSWPGYPWPVWIGPAYTFAPGYRAQRITELIDPNSPLTLAPISVDDMKAIQTDVVCIPARNFIPIILGTMGYPASTGNATIDQALGILAAWNCSELRGLAAPLIWEVFFDEFGINTFADELGAFGLYPFANVIIPLWNMTLDMSLGRPNPYAIMFFDDKNTPGWPPPPLGNGSGWELMPQIINKSLHDAVNWITSKLGSNMTAWKYGDIHKVQFKHPMGDLIGYLNVPANPLAGPGPAGMDGGPYTVNPGGHHHGLIIPSPLLTTAGASYRGIYECKEGWDTSWIVVPPGESGHYGNPHYDDQFPLWLGNAYGWKPCLFNDTEIMTYSKTTFHPDMTPPVADAGPYQTVDEGTMVFFDGSGSYDDVGIVSWEWDFGDPHDPTKKYTPTANHTFMFSGSYIVTLTVWDPSDNNDSDTLTVHVLPPPQPPPVGGKAEPISIPIDIATSIWILLIIVMLPLVATIVFVKLKKEKKQ